MRPAWTSCIPARNRRRRRTPPADAAASRPPTGNLLPAGRPRRTTARRTRASRQGRPRRRLPRSTRLPGAQAACSASRFAVMPKRRDTGQARETRGRSWEAARQRSLGRYSQSARRAGRPGTFDISCAGRESTTRKSVAQAGKWPYLMLRSPYDELEAQPPPVGEERQPRRDPSFPREAQSPRLEFRQVSDWASPPAVSAERVDRHLVELDRPALAARSWAHRVQRFVAALHRILTLEQGDADALAGLTVDEHQHLRALESGAPPDSTSPRTLLIASSTLPGSLSKVATRANTITPLLDRLAALECKRRSRPPHHASSRRSHAAAPGGSSSPTVSLARISLPAGSANGSALTLTAQTSSSRSKTSAPGGPSRQAKRPLGSWSIARR